LRGGGVAANPSTSDARRFGRDWWLSILPVELGEDAAGAGVILICARFSVGAAESFVTPPFPLPVISSEGFAALGPAFDGVPLRGEPGEEPEGGGPPSLANRLRRICSIVSLSGASGTDAGGRFGSMLCGRRRRVGARLS